MINPVFELIAKIAKYSPEKDLLKVQDYLLQNAPDEYRIREEKVSAVYKNSVYKYIEERRKIEEWNKLMTS